MPSLLSKQPVLKFSSDNALNVTYIKQAPVLKQVHFDYPLNACVIQVGLCVPHFVQGMGVEGGEGRETTFSFLNTRPFSKRGLF